LTGKDAQAAHRLTHLHTHTSTQHSTNAATPGVLKSVWKSHKASTVAMRPTQIFTSVCLLAAASSAWQPMEVVKRELEPLIARQQSTTKFDLSYTGKQGNTATTIESSTATDSDATATGTGTSKETGKTTGKSAGTSGSNKGSTTVATTKTFDPRLPAGGLSMITPSAAETTYYKIKDYVTFAWNYTSLSVTPSAIDILAYCATNSATYTLAMNQSVTGPTQAITWDTNGYQETASTTLLTGTYTLIVHDAAKDVSAIPQAGYLGTYEQFTFGMYTPQAYVPLSDYQCATCNAALSSMERQTLGFMFGMAALTVLSFGWFAGAAGLW